MNTDTPRTDAHQAKDGMAHDWLWREFACKLECELSEARHQLLAIFAREHLTCGWCGEMMQAPPGFTPPMTTDKVKAAVRIHILDCPKHPIRETERELEDLIAAARAVVNRWDTPLWKNVPATAEYINRLRAAVKDLAK
jgi:hypothetical protein